MSKIESRWPHLTDAASLRKLTVKLTGPLPASPHARADALDALAAKQARAEGLVIIAVAGDAAAGEDGDGKSKTRRATLMREYWAAPEA